MIKLPPKTWEQPWPTELRESIEGPVICTIPQDDHDHKTDWIIKVLEQIVEHLNDIERAPFKDVYYKDIERDSILMPQYMSGKTC